MINIEDLIDEWITQTGRMPSMLDIMAMNEAMASAAIDDDPNYPQTMYRDKVPKITTMEDENGTSTQ